jgi:hypothetical protein
MSGEFELNEEIQSPTLNTKYATSLSKNSHNLMSP